MNEILMNGDVISLFKVLCYLQYAVLFFGLLHQAFFIQKVERPYKRLDK